MRRGARSSAASAGPCSKATSAGWVEGRLSRMRQEQPMTRIHRITRRQALKVTAGAVGATLPLVHVQTATAAGKLTMGIWDHWVPAANPVLRGLVDEWAAKNKVDVAIDFIPSAGNKMILTQA